MMAFAWLGWFCVLGLQLLYWIEWFKAKKAGARMATSTAAATTYPAMRELPPPPAAHV